MTVTIQYTGQLATLAGKAEETAELPAPATVQHLITELVGRHGPGYCDLLLTPEGALRPSLLVILDGEQAVGDWNSLLLDGVKTVMLMTPIAGG